MSAQSTATNFWQQTKSTCRATYESIMRYRHWLLLVRVRRWQDHLPNSNTRDWPDQLSDLDRVKLNELMTSKDAKKALKQARLNKAFAERWVEAEALINTLADKTALLEFDLASVVPKAAFKPYFLSLLSSAQGAWNKGRVRGIWGGIEAPKITRPVCDLNSNEKSALRISAIFFAHTGERKIYNRDRAEIIYCQGRARHNHTGDAAYMIDSGLRDYLTQHDSTISLRLSEAQKVSLEDPGSLIATDLKPYIQQGQSWSDGHEAPFCAFDPGRTLALGRMPNGSLIAYKGNESLITIGGPGSGKSQAHVLPNVLYYNGPMIILDIKGEVFSATAGYRQSRHQRILKFSLQGDVESHRYNPLDQISRDPDHLYEDAHRLAELVVVKGPTDNDPFWVNSARDLVAGVIASVIADPDTPDKNFTAVLDRLMTSGKKRLAMLDRIETIGRLMEIRPLAYAGDSLRSLAKDSDRTFEGIAQQARQALTPFGSTSAETALSGSDWQPEELRENGTALYITVPQDRLEFFASVIRVLIAQHLDAAMRSSVEAQDRLPLTFFLDELPQLGNFEQAVKAVELGRGYGVRVWGFAQNTQQIERSFERSNILLEGVAVRSFLSIDQDAAERLTHALGEVEDIVTGETRPLATVAELLGPELRNKGIILGRNAKPIKADLPQAWQEQADDLNLDYIFTSDGWPSS